MHPPPSTRPPARRFGRQLLIWGGVGLGMGLLLLVFNAAQAGLALLLASGVAMGVGAFAQLLPPPRVPGQAPQGETAADGFTGWTHDNSQSSGGMEAGASDAGGSDGGGSSGGDGGGAS